MTRLDRLSKLVAKLEAADDRRRRAEWLRDAVLDSAIHGMIVADEAGEIQFANAAACETFKYTHDELIGENVRVLMPEPMRGEHDSYIARYLETGERQVIGRGRMTRGVTKTGQLLEIALSINEVQFDGERLFIATLIVRSGPDDTFDA